MVQSFRQFIEENRDEITALQVLYQRPYSQRLRYADIKALADAMQLPPRSWTTNRLWEAYRQLDESKVRGSGQRTLADIVSVVRYAIGGEDELAPFADGVRERFNGWLAMQQTAGNTFTEEQIRWLEDIRDHIAGSVSMEMADFQYAPFNQQGGLGKAYELFGDELERNAGGVERGLGGVAPQPTVLNGRKPSEVPGNNREARQWLLCVCPRPARLRCGRRYAARKPSS